MVLRVDARDRRSVEAMAAVLCEARRSSGRGRGEVAAVLGFSERSVRDWERSYDHPSLGHLVQWAGALGFQLVLRGEGRAVVAVVPAGAALPGGLCGVGAYLAGRRGVLNLSQTQVGLLAGVARTSVQRWECAETPLRLVALVVWARVLGCSVGLMPVGGVGGGC